MAAAGVLARPALSAPPDGRPLPLAAIEVVRLSGSRQSTDGPSQWQVQPLHIYDEHRPAPRTDIGRPTAPRTVRISALYLRLRTKDGPEGVYGPIDRETVPTIVERFRPFLVGQDALAHDILWDKLYRLDRHSRVGHYLMALSAVDNALWDLRGRHYGVPVYRLLGGPGRTEVDAYASCLGYSVEPEAAGERAAALKKDGWRFQKWFLAHGPGDGAAGMARNVALVRELRRAVGDDVDIMFDAFSGWDLNYALAWAKQVEGYRPRWIEEAVHPERIESFVELRRRTSIPIASGEHFYGRWEAHRYLQAGALDVVQSDPEWCGGVSELVKTCTVASLHDVQVIPHGHSIHAALHTVASQPPLTCPLVERLMNKQDAYYHFESRSVVPRQGRLPLPAQPGFGIEWDTAKVEKQELL